jgi:hypothetical protein
MNQNCSWLFMGKNEDNTASVRPGMHMPDGTVYAGLSHTGRVLYAMPNDAPKAYTFPDAPKYAAQLNRQRAHGHDDWRVPNEDELDVLWMNRAVIGGFNETGARPWGWYWSSSCHKSGSTHARGQRFSDGYRSNNGQRLKSSIRCVRG